MKITTIKAYMLKEFIELFRTRLIVMVYLMPTMILLLFGYGIRMDVSHARILIIDNDQSRYSQILTSKFEHTKYFNAKVAHLGEKEALRLVKQAKVDAIVIIPSSFEKKLSHAQKSEIGVFVDAAFPTRATTIESYIQGSILNAASEMAQKNGLLSKGVSPSISVHFLIRRCVMKMR